MGGTAKRASIPSRTLSLMVNGTQFGSTWGTLNGEGIYTFSGTPFTVPAGKYGEC